MADTRPTRSRAPTDGAAAPAPPLLIVLSTLTAGAADALTFLAARVFVANMTGNTVLLGLYAAQGDALPALHSVVALAAYAIGVGLGVLLIGGTAGATPPWRGVLLATAVEALFLAGFAAGAALLADTNDLLPLRILIACSGVAMGLQSAAMLRLRLPGLMTTYITGTITALVAGRFQRGTAPSSGNAGLQALVFATYLAAAFGAVLLHGRWPGQAAVAPLLTIIGVCLLVARRARTNA